VHSTCLELYRLRTNRHWLHQKLVAFARALSGKPATLRGQAVLAARRSRRDLTRTVPRASLERKQCPQSSRRGMERDDKL
jgi:hypothetical protein